MPLLFAVGGVLSIAGVTLTAIGGTKKNKCKALLNTLADKYETSETQQWLWKAEEFAKKRQAYEEENEQYQQTLAQLQQLKEEGRNLSMMIQQTTVLMYGYDTIEEAESSL
jgi:lipid A disaccharide synthetase